MATFDTLSAMDAQFLYWDSDRTPMNMGNLCIFEGGPLTDERGAFKLEDVRRAIESRLHLVPRYRRKVLEVPGGFAHPVLVDDPDFDIARHVKLVALPRPGTDDVLKETFAQLHEGMLDHGRPLWEITFIEGLDGGRVGMVQKIHHAPFDGTSTVDVMELLFDDTPEFRYVEPPPWRPEAAAGPAVAHGREVGRAGVEPVEGRAAAAGRILARPAGRALGGLSSRCRISSSRPRRRSTGRSARAAASTGCRRRSPRPSGSAPSPRAARSTTRCSPPSAAGCASS